jgi:hypothetical protein
MTSYKYTPYFENEVLRKRPYLKKEWCIRVLENLIRRAKKETDSGSGVVLKSLETEF